MDFFRKKYKKFFQGKLLRLGLESASGDPIYNYSESPKPRIKKKMNHNRIHGLLKRTGHIRQSAELKH